MFPCALSSISSCLLARARTRTHRTRDPHRDGNISIQYLQPASEKSFFLVFYVHVPRSDPRVTECWRRASESASLRLYWSETQHTAHGSSERPACLWSNQNLAQISVAGCSFLGDASKTSDVSEVVVQMTQLLLNDRSIVRSQNGWPKGNNCAWRSPVIRNWRNPGRVKFSPGNRTKRETIILATHKSLNSCVRKEEKH